MAYEQKDMGGSLFKNKLKEEGDNKPDYKGNCLINGASLEIAAWIKEGSKGGKFMSLKFQPARDKTDPGAYVKPPPIPAPAERTPDDDVPF